MLAAPRKRYAESAKRLLNVSTAKAIRELDAEIAQIERNLRKGEARLPSKNNYDSIFGDSVETQLPSLVNKS